MNLKSYLSLGAASIAVLASAGAASAATITIEDGSTFTLGIGKVGLFADPVLSLDTDGDLVADAFAPNDEFVINRVEFAGPIGTSNPLTLIPANNFAETFVGTTNIPEIDAVITDGVVAFVKSFDFNDVDKFRIVGTPDLSFAGDNQVANTFDVLDGFGNFIEIELDNPPDDPRDDLVVDLEQITTFQPVPLSNDDDVSSEFAPSVRGFGELRTTAGEFIADITLAGTFPTDQIGDDATEDSEGNVTITVVTRPSEPNPVPEPASLLGLFSVLGLAGLAKAKSRK